MLVAYTIEFDNEFEHQMPHRTTDYGGPRAVPWLTSLAMWYHCMAFVGDNGISVRELVRRARTKANLDGMRRWGYITLSNNTLSGMIHATASGRQAQMIWAPLFDAMENRWRLRFGDALVRDCRLALFAFVAQFEAVLPDCLPKVGYGFFSRDVDTSEIAQPGRESDHSLISLLSKVLLAFALEFEGDSPVSFAVCANLLRVLNKTGIRVRDLPALSGIAKNVVDVGLGYLVKARMAVIEAAASAARTKVARLTPAGMDARARYVGRVEEIETQWATKFGILEVRSLRSVLQKLVVSDSDESPLFQGMTPYAEGWRAAIAPRVKLPHFPMVTHRGGFPDGS